MKLWKLHPHRLRNLWTLYRMAARTHGPIGALADVPRTLHHAKRAQPLASYVCQWCGARALASQPSTIVRACPECGGQLVKTT